MKHWQLPLWNIQIKNTLENYSEINSHNRTLKALKLTKLTVPGRLFQTFITLLEKKFILPLLHLGLYNLYACPLVFYTVENSKTCIFLWHTVAWCQLRVSMAVTQLLTLSTCILFLIPTGPPPSTAVKKLKLKKTTKKAVRDQTFARRAEHCPDHVTSSITWPFDSWHAFSYWCSIVIAFLLAAVFEILVPKHVRVTALTFQCHVTHLTSLVTWPFDSPCPGSSFGT